jgi:hypothetical protein
MLSKGKKALPVILASIRVHIATEGLAIIRVKLNRATEKKNERREWWKENGKEE